MQVRQTQPGTPIRIPRLAVYAVDESNNVLRWSREAELLLGWTEEEVRGRPLPLTGAIELDGGASAETTLVRHKDGRELLVRITACPIRGPAGENGGTAFFVESAPEDHVPGAETEALRARQRFLVEATEALVSSLDYSLTLRRLAHLVVPELADWCSIDMVTDGSIETLVLAHADPQKVEAARELQRRYPTPSDPARGAPNVIRTGVTEFYGEITDELLAEAAVDDTHLQLLRELDLSEIVIIPLTGRGRTFGAMTLVVEAGRRFGPDDVALAEELARRAALAVDNARLFTAERRARQQVERLQSLTAALAETLTTEQVSSLIAEQAVTALGAAAGAVLLMRPGGRELGIVASAGYGEGMLEKYARVRLDASLPVAEAVRTGVSIWLESLDETAARYPDLAEVADRVGQAFAVIPLRVGRRISGAIALSFDTPHAFASDERRFIGALAGQCAQAFERARLYEGEQAARARAEQARGRLQRMQEILEIGLTSPSLDELLNELLTRLRTLVGADTATIFLQDESGTNLHVHASVGLYEKPFTDIAVPLGEGLIGRIAATGKPLVIGDLGGTTSAQPELHGKPWSFVGVPLLTEEGASGVIQMTSKHIDHFTREEVALLQAVAARTALAIDRARLYEREHQIAETLQRSMLPQEMPEIRGLELAARYVPGSTGVSVGGDWYDTVELPTGAVGIAVGDIVGKGLRAATEMVQLRNAFRAYALEGLEPSEVLERLNGLVERQGHGQYSTVVYAMYDPRRGAVRFASAGHPPPLVRRADGSVSFIEGGRSLPLGVAPELDCQQAETLLERGATLVLYTDGLIERREAGIAEGLARLAQVAGSAPSELERFVDELIAETVGTDLDDDVGLLALRPVAVTSHLSLGVPAEPESLGHLRRELRAWLRQLGVSSEEISRITSASNEACANAIEHPLSPTSPMVRIDADVVDSQLSLVVRDSGRWRPPEPQSDRGLGLRLMRDLMDEVEINRLSEGTELRMSRAFDLAERT